MQSAKDSFYVALRTRLVGINPQRTVLLRGAVRPGIVVEEAEAPFSQLPVDVFVLRWAGIGVERDLPASMVAEECEVLYSTLGTQSFGGLDRGRALTAMDCEFLAMLTPFWTAKFNYATQPAVAMATKVFWDQPVMGAVTSVRDRLSRVAKVVVYSYEEPGE